MPHLTNLDNCFYGYLPGLGVSSLRNEPVVESLFFFWGEELVPRGVRKVDDDKVGENGNRTGYATLDDEDPFPASRNRVLCNLGKAISDNVGEGGCEGRYSIEYGDTVTAVTLAS